MDYTNNPYEIIHAVRNRAYEINKELANPELGVGEIKLAGEYQLIKPFTGADMSIKIEGNECKVMVAHTNNNHRVAKAEISFTKDEMMPYFHSALLSGLIEFARPAA